MLLFSVCTTTTSKSHQTNFTQHDSPQQRTFTFIWRFFSFSVALSLFLSHTHAHTVFLFGKFEHKTIQTNLCAAIILKVRFFSLRIVRREEHYELPTCSREPNTVCAWNCLLMNIGVIRQLHSCRSTLFWIIENRIASIQRAVEKAHMIRWCDHHINMLVCVCL